MKGWMKGQIPAIAIERGALRYAADHQQIYSVEWLCKEIYSFSEEEMAEVEKELRLSKLTPLQRFTEEVFDG